MSLQPEPQQSPAAMRAPVVALIVRHPEGSIRVSTPTNVPLGELLPDLLELAGLPDHDGWTLGPVGGDPYPPDRTLAELGVDDGGLLALRNLPGHRPAYRDSATTQRMIRPRVGLNTQAGGRPLSDRSARLLPVRLSIPARCLTVLGALARGDRGERHHDHGALGVLRPAGFTRPARLSPLARAREAWAHSDYRERLELAIAGPHLQRCVTIAVVSPKGALFSRLFSVLPRAAWSH